MGNPLFAASSAAWLSPRRLFSKIVFAFAAPVALGLTACGDDNLFLSPASIENTVRSYSVFSLSGTSATLPAAYSYTTETLERPQILSNGATNFDVAFDLNSAGKVDLIPVRVLVPLPPAGAPAVGILKTEASFDAAVRAPDKGYVNDSTVSVGVGETVVLMLGGSGCVYGDPYYAKLVIDSIVSSERRIVARSLVNRNCGYRSLTAGLPKN